VAQTLRAAIDIGGTFTDLVCYDDARSEVRFEKGLTTPAALDAGVMECFAKGAVDVAALQQFVHGSTVAINAVIQKTGARTALVTTAGFEDVYEIGRANRPDTYNLRFEKPAPLVPADLRFGVRERLDAAGKVLVPLNAKGALEAVRAMRAAGVEAIAICFLHAYANAAHEMRMRKLIERELPGVYVTASHEVLREYREYERTSTTVLNAYVGSEVSRYLGELEQPLRAQAFSGRFFIMQSNGGVMTATRAREIPVAMMESGPAGGVIGAAALGRLAGAPDVIAFDMGGTTAKTCLIEGGLPKMTDQYYIGGYRDGYPMRLPAVDIIEVGAGGGSIAWIDPGGALRVGPRSAGSVPGPACYGRGGREPTVTDANLVVGRLNPTRFLGGEFDLDPGAAEAAVRERTGAPLGLDLEQAAYGVIKLADARMSFAVRAITLQRGYDPRRFAMVAFGGAGPLHAMAIARELHIPKVIIPPQPGHFSALGMLLTDLRQDVLRTRVADFGEIDAKTLDNWFEELEREAAASLAAQGFADRSVALMRSLDMRYLGQEYTVTVAVPELAASGDPMPELRRRFDAAYELRYSHASPEQPAQVVNLRVTALGAVAKPDFASLRDKRIAAAPGARERAVYFESTGAVRCPVFQRAELVEGQPLEGPAIVEEYASTTVIHPGDAATLDAHGCLVVRTGA